MMDLRTFVASTVARQKQIRKAFKLINWMRLFVRLVLDSLILEHFSPTLSSKT